MVGIGDSFHGAAAAVGIDGKKVMAKSSLPRVNAPSNTYHERGVVW